MKVNFLFKIAFYPVLFLLMVSCSHSGNKEKPQGKYPAVNAAGITQDSSISRVVGIGLVEPEALITSLSVESPGTIKAILCHEGEAVKAGDVILKLDDTSDLLELRKLRARKKNQEYNISSAAAKVRESEADLERRQAKLKTSEDLVKSGAVTKESLEDLSLEVKNLQLRLAGNKAALDAAESGLNEINADIAAGEETLRKKTLVAPVDGTILQILVTPYSSVNQFQNAVNFAPAGPVIARCEVDEMYAGLVKNGQAAEIRKIGFSKVIATGRVVQTSPYLKQKSLFVESSTDRQDRRVREVRIRIDDPDGLLFNSRVECSINTGNH